MGNSPRRAIAGMVCMAMIGIGAIPAQAANSEVTLTLFRAVRISDSSIAISFVTNTESIGTMVYTGANERVITLTDSVPQIDHLFTIEDVDPQGAYSFNIKADAGTDTSHKYVVLLSPQGVGNIGESIVPGVQEFDGNKKLVAAQLAAPSVSVTTNSLPLISGIVVVAIGFAIWLAYSFIKKRREKNTVTF